MEIRKLLFVPALVGALALGACGEEEEAGLGEGVEEGAVIETGAGPVEEGVGAVEGAVGEVGEGVVGGTEILGNGIDDDGDGLVDEEA